MGDETQKSRERSRRLPKKLLHGGDYNPDQWLDRPDILEKDLAYMKEAKVNVVTLGVFSWSVYEPEEGTYNFQWLDDIMDRLYDNGIYVILATPSGARPAWMDEKYPEILRVNEYGIPNTHGVRHNHCMSSPAYREKVRVMDEMLAQRYGKHPALILWHISNELGGQCFCPLCAARFREFLKKRYGTIDQLNHQWWTTFWSHRFNSFDQIDPPSKRGETSIHGLNLDWKRFTTWNMTDFMTWEIQALRKWAPDIPVTTNFMRLYKGLDYHAMAPELDIISWDSYPAWGNPKETLTDTCFRTAFEHGVMRSMKPDRPFLLMESVPSIVNWHEANRLKRPGVHELTSLQAVACGSDSVLYFQWRKGRGSYEQYHGAVIDHLGTNTTRVFKDVAHLGQTLEELSYIQGSIGKNPAAIIFDWENRWAIEDMAGLSNRKNYDETIQSFHKVLLEHGIDGDMIPGDGDFENYKVLIAPMLYLLKPNTAKKLKAFVKNGGILLATYLTGYVNENTLCWLGGFPGDSLRELFGLYSEEIDSLYPEESNGLEFCGPLKGDENKTYEIRDFCELIHVEGACVMGKYTRDFYQNMPALTKNTYGKGQAWYLAARADEPAMAVILGKICQEAGLLWETLPKGLEIHRRYTEDGRCFTFNMNTTNAPLHYRGLSLGPLETKIIESKPE